MSNERKSIFWLFQVLFWSMYCADYALFPALHVHTTITRRNKKVLRDHKRRTARDVASLAVLSGEGGYPHPGWRVPSPWQDLGPRAGLWTGPMRGLRVPHPLTQKGPGTRNWGTPFLPLPYPSPPGGQAN